MNVLMPQLGETVNEGTVTAWHKRVGDIVVKDELLFDVETEKVATEVPAPASGTLTRIAVEEGTTVDVGTVLAVIADSDKQVHDQGETHAEDVSGAEPSLAQQPAKPYKPDGAVAGKRLSPAVRRLLIEHQIDVSLIHGSGRDGRITRNDVLAKLETLSRGHAETGSSRDKNPDGELIPFNRIRRATAEHMTRSKATSPHVLQATEVDFSHINSVRQARKVEWKNEHGFSLTYLPFLAHAVSRALGAFPHINSSVTQQGLRVHAAVNLSIAVDLEHAGLVAPVVMDAAGLNVPELSIRIHELVQKARAGKLEPDDLSGGTYTLSNPGPFGTLFTAPIINQPQTAILSMDAVSRKPVVIDGPEGETIAIRQIGVLAQSFDHRAFDGAYSAAYLNKLKSLIEQDDWKSHF